MDIVGPDHPACLLCCLPMSPWMILAIFGTLMLPSEVEAMCRLIGTDAVLCTTQ